MGLVDLKLVDKCESMHTLKNLTSILNCSSLPQLPGLKSSLPGIYISLLTADDFTSA